MSYKLQVCIVGLGRAGNFHLDSISRIPNLELKYVVDPELKELAAPAAGKTVVLKELEPALADPSLDAVIVASPTQWHYQHILKSLESGKHVFAEKPLGKSLQEINDCYDISGEKGLKLYLGFQRRYDLNFITLKKSLGSIGQVRIIKTSSRDNPQPSLDYLRNSGNIFHDMLIHDLDMLLFLLGLKVPDKIFATAHAYDPEIMKLPDFDTVLVTLKYADGLICTIDSSRTSVYGYDQRLELFGEKGMATANNQLDHTIQLHTAQGIKQGPINYSFPQRYKESYFREMEHFVQGIISGDQHNVSRNECLLGFLMAEAAHQAATSDQVVNFKEVFGVALRELTVENN